LRQVVITRHGAPDVLELREQATPAPAAGEVRIAVRASGVNFADILARIGLYPDAPRPPVVVGYEVAGVVDAVGAGVTRVQEGDRVVALTRFGGYATHVVVPAEFAFGIPPGMSDPDAAAVPVNYLTALLALYKLANVAAGETALIHGAGGGVGIAATQLARLRRATIIGTASAAKHDALRAFGVDHVIDYRVADVAREVRRVTGSRGVDVVLDPLGGKSFDTSYRLLAPLGRLVMYGVSTVAPGERRSWWQAARTMMQMPSFRPLSLMNHNRGVFGLNLGHLWGEQRQLSAAMQLLIQEIEARRLQPVVARTFPLERAADAHRFMQSRANIGKVVLTCAET
jgi:synaptic vesicle membrane protein VAT-1